MDKSHERIWVQILENWRILQLYVADQDTTQIDNNIKDVVVKAISRAYNRVSPKIIWVVKV